MPDINSTLIKFYLGLFTYSQTKEIKSDFQYKLAVDEVFKNNISKIKHLKIQ